MQSHRLLIFGINYAPEPTGTALNTTGLAEGLARLGWDVSVVTGIPHYPYWRAESAPKRALEERVDVTRRRHYVPSRQSAARRGAYELTWVVSALPTILRRRKPDLVLGVVPSLGGAVLAAAAARRYGVPWALKFQDLMGRAAAQSHVHGAARVADAVARAEIALARRADRIAIIAEGFRDYFLAAGIDPARIHRVRDPARLGIARESRASVRSRLGWADDEFVVLHTGSMGYKQGLETLVAAARLARDDPSLRFVLQGEGNQRAKLEQMARELGVANVTFLPLAPADEFASVLEAADTMLLMQRGSVRNMSLPAKLSSYFSSGVPIVAAVAAEDETAREIEAAGAGVVVRPDDPQLLLAEIVALRRDPARRARLGAAGKAYAERYLSTPSSLSQMSEFLEGCLSQNGREAVSRRAA